MKKNISLEKYSRLINSGCVILVTSKFKRKSNILTVAWHTPVSKIPPLLAISIAKGHFSYKIIFKSKEFVINVPSARLLKKVKFCGTFSGRNIDKFKDSRLTRLPAEKVGVPLVKECIAHIECKVVKIYSLGDHAVFIGRVVNASVDAGLFDGEFLLIDRPFAHTINHLGKNRYTVAREMITI